MHSCFSGSCRGATQFLCRKAGEDFLYAMQFRDRCFVMMGQEEEKGTVRCDLTGNIYSETVFASILSMFYFRRLMSDERFPDTLNGVTVTPKIVQTENFNFRSAPTDINTPSIRLYPLLESMSGRVDLKMPGITFTSYTDKYVMPRFEQSFNVTYK